MPRWRLEPGQVERLHRTAGASRWDLPVEVFAEALERSARRAFPEPPDGRALSRYAEGLRLDDLALACACAIGHEGAWEHFVREFRPLLYRAASGLDPGGAARDLADSLYGELFGLTERDGKRRSHFEYFHGRSSLATWLRAVLAQRLVDRVRDARRYRALPEEEGADSASGPAASRMPAGDADPDRSRHETLLRDALTTAVEALAPRDRLRLRCYYAQQLTLAQIGRALGEHEATVSRQLGRARRAIRAAVEQALEQRHGLSAAAVADCFASVAADPGALDVAELLGTGGARKDAPPDRSEEEAGTREPRPGLGKEGSA